MRTGQLTRMSRRPRLEAADLDLIGEQNLHMLNALALVRCCVGRLVRDGFTVISIHVEQRKPVIWIQRCARCEDLNGAVMIRRHDAVGAESVMVAPLDGCQVQWRVGWH